MQNRGTKIITVASSRTGAAVASAWARRVHGESETSLAGWLAESGDSEQSRAKVRTAPVAARPIHHCPVGRRPGSSVSLSSLPGTQKPCRVSQSRRGPLPASPYPNRLGCSSYSTVAVPPLTVARRGMIWQRWRGFRAPRPLTLAQPSRVR
jgi:hypothetical protein